MLSYLLIVCVHGEACYFGPVKMDGHNVFGRQEVKKSDTIAIAQDFDKAKFYMEALDEGGRLKLTRSEELTKLGILGAVAVDGKGWVFEKNLFRLFVPTMVKTWQEIKDLDKTLKSLMDRYGKKDQVFKPEHRFIDPVKNDVQLKELQDKLARSEEKNKQKIDEGNTALDQLKKEKLAQEEVLKKLQSENITLQQTSGNMEAEKQKLKEEIEQKQGKIDALSTDLDQLKNQHQTTAKQLDALKTEREQLKKSCDDLQQQQLKATAEAAQKQESVQKLQAELDLLKQQNAEQENTLKNQIENLTQERGALQELYQNLQQPPPANAQREQGDIDLEKERLKLEINQKRITIERLTTDLQNLKNDNQTIEGKLTALMQERQKLQESYEILQGMYTNTRKNKEDIEKEAKDIKDDIEQKKRNIAQLTEDLTLLQRERVRQKEELQKLCKTSTQIMLEKINLEKTVKIIRSEFIKKMLHIFCEDAITLQTDMYKDALNLFADLKQNTFIRLERQDKLKKICELDAELKRLTRSHNAKENDLIRQIEAVKLKRRELKVSYDALTQEKQVLIQEKREWNQKEQRWGQEKIEWKNKNNQLSTQIDQQRVIFNQQLQFFDQIAKEVHRLELQQINLIQFFTQIIDKTTAHILEPKDVSTFEHFHEKLDNWTVSGNIYTIESHDLQNFYNNYIQAIGQIDDKVNQFKASNLVTANTNEPQPLSLQQCDINKQKYRGFVCFMAQIITLATNNTVNFWPGNFDYFTNMLTAWSEYPQASVFYTQEVKSLFERFQNPSPGIYTLTPSVISLDGRSEASTQDLLAQFEVVSMGS